MILHHPNLPCFTGSLGPTFVEQLAGTVDSPAPRQGFGEERAETLSTGALPSARFARIIWVRPRRYTLCRLGFSGCVGPGPGLVGLEANILRSVLRFIHFSSHHLCLTQC